MVEPIYDSSAEGGVIATLLYKPQFVLESDFLQPSHFYDSAMGCIYHAIKTLFIRGNQVDIFSISSEIKNNPQISRIYENSNMPDLQELKDISEVIARENVEDYVQLAKIVQANAYKRQLSSKLYKIIDKCKDVKLPVDEINSEVYTTIEDLSKKFVVEDDLDEFSTKIDCLWSDIEKDRIRDNSSKIRWKWDILNEYAPLELTEMYIFGGRRKAGKSVLLMEQAMFLLRNDIPVLYIDSEMSDKLFIRRMLANLTNIDVKRIKDGTYSEEESAKITNALAWLKSKKFWHIYRPEYDELKLYNTCRILHDRFGLEVLVYDYIKNNSDTSELNYNKLGAMADFLKNKIAGSLNMVVISAVQLNRQNEVADSDKIERYVSFSAKWQVKNREMVESDGVECGNAFMKISANRLGEQHDMTDDSDYFDFCFYGGKMRIEQAKQHSQEEGVFT